MLAFLIRRLLQSIVVMFTVGLIAFSMFRFVGDPVNQDRRDRHAVAERAEMRRAARPQRPDPRAVHPLRRQRGAGRFRQVLPVPDAGQRADRRADAGHPGAGGRGRVVGAAGRDPDGRLDCPAPTHDRRQAVHGGVARRRVAADLPRRHPADLRVCGQARLAALVRARRRGAARLVDEPASSPRPASSR